MVKRMKNLPFLILLIVLSSCGIQHRFASSNEAKTDDSYIYTLPYPKGKSYLMIQGYESQLSHKGWLGLDFKMKKGSLIAAARNGVVVRVVEEYKKGGISKKHLSGANQVIIRHNDGSQAIYGHLQYNGALVNMGDTVQAGQVIAKAGSTGYSAISHLHFSVWTTAQSRRLQQPTRFRTKKGVLYLQPGRWYKAP